MSEDKLAQLNLKAGEYAANRLVDYCRDVADIVGGSPPRPPNRNDAAGALGALVAEGRRIDKVTGDVDYSSTPAGRHFTFMAPEGAGDDERGGIMRYDVVTIGGWTMSVPGWQEPGQAAGVQTVNGWFKQQNNVFARNLTVAEVGAGSWTWGGGGNTETHFALAAILHGTRHLIPEFEAHWWNRIVPADILFARAIGENNTGGPITLSLTIGQIGG